MAYTGTESLLPTVDAKITPIHGGGYVGGEPPTASNASTTDLERKLPEGFSLELLEGLDIPEEIKKAFLEQISDPLNCLETSVYLYLIYRTLLYLVLIEYLLLSVVCE